MNDDGVDDDLLNRLIAPIAWQPVEFCVMLYIGEQGKLLGLRHVRGDISGMEVPVRLIAADALTLDATGAILAHNHPSGDPAASPADFTLTRRMGRTFQAIGITLIDHVIVAGDRRFSFRAAGHL